MPATDNIRAAIKDQLGFELVSCPWRAFAHPLVGDVMRSVQFMESGNLSTALIEPSHRLIEGIGLWNQVNNRMTIKKLEAERKEREANSR